MLIEKLYHHLLALPDRDAEQALLAFRASAEAWDVSLGIVSGSQGPVPDELALFAAQTLHACARRLTPPDGESTPNQAAVCALVTRQQALLAALTHPSNQGGQKVTLLCAALAALSVRNASTLCDMLAAALHQLPQPLAVQLLLSVAEEGEALQARAGSQLELCAGSHHVLREEVGHHALAWLAAIAAAALQQAPLQQPDGSQCQQQAPPKPPPQPQQQHHHHQHHGHHPRDRLHHLLVLVVRCFGAWSRLGCLFAACCPAGAVRQLLGLSLQCAHPGGGVPTALRREASEALGDVIEHGPDALLRELQVPMLQIAAAATAAAAASVADPGGGGAAAIDALYESVQLVSSYAAARLGELVPAVCQQQQKEEEEEPETEAGDRAALDGGVALVRALCQLAALPNWTDEGYPVSWPAMQVLADLALACIASAPPPPLYDMEALTAAAGGPAAARAQLPAGAGIASCGFGDGAMAVDEVQQDGGGGGGGRGGGGAGGGGGATACADSGGADADQSPAPSADHCVPDITPGPRPGLPPQLQALYDDVLRAVLSCCVAWSLLDADSDSGGPPAGPAGASPLAAGGAGAGGNDCVGLLRLPPECDETLRGCLQACGGVVGQARMLETAIVMLQQTGEQAAMAAAAAEWRLRAELQGGGTTCGGGGGATAAALAGAAPPQTVAAAGMSSAALTAALAAVAACGTLRTLAVGPKPGDEAASAAAAAASRILLAAAGHVTQGREVWSGAAVWLTAPAAGRHAATAPAGLAIPLTLHYCDALAASCGAVLQLHQRAGPLLSTGFGAPAASCTTEGVSGALCRLAEPALAGLRREATAAAAARALRALVTASSSPPAGPGASLPAALAAAVVDALHALPYDAGPGYRAAELELLRAAVEAAAMASSSLAEHGPDRAELLQRLLSPAVVVIDQVAAAVTAAPASSPSPSPPPQLEQPQLQLQLPPLTLMPVQRSPPSASAAIPGHHDAALTRQLRLLEAALTTTTTTTTTTIKDNVNTNSTLPSPVGSAFASPASTASAAIFVRQTWAPLQALLRRGASGRFLLPLCKCLAVLLRTAATQSDTTTANPGVAPALGGGSDVVATGHDGGAFGQGAEYGVKYGGFATQASPVALPPLLLPLEPDPWVASVLEVLPACVGRPGAKHVYEPLAALLEACAAAEVDVSPRWGGTCAAAGLQVQQQDQAAAQHWRQRHAALAASTLYDILYGRVAAGLAATWRAADRDPDSAECLLRLAMAAVRYDWLLVSATAPPQTQQQATNCGSSDMDVATSGTGPYAGVQVSTMRAALATAALRLAAASSGCDHRQVATSALTCTCAVLEAACRQRRLGSREPGGGGDSSAATVERPETLAVAVQMGPLVTAGLLAALQSSSPLSRLQRVVSALLLLGTAAATCYELEQLQLQHQQPYEEQGVTPTSTEAEVGACSGLLGSWLTAAAAYLQMPESQGAALASSLAPLLAEAGVSAAAAAAAAAAVAGEQLPGGSTAVAGGCGDGGAGGRVLHRRLRRLLREFVESRLRG